MATTSTSFSPSSSIAIVAERSGSVGAAYLDTMLALQDPLELTRYIHSYDTELYSLWHGDHGDEYCPVSLANRPLNCNVHMDVSPLQQGPTAGCLSMLRPVWRFGHLEGRSLRVIWLGRVCSYSFAIDSFIHYKLADCSSTFAFTDFPEARRSAPF